MPPFVLVFTFYSGDDMIGLDVQPYDRYVEPLEVMTMVVDAPIASEFAVVSFSRIDTDDMLWVELFRMVGCDGEEN